MILLFLCSKQDTQHISINNTKPLFIFTMVTKKLKRYGEKGEGYSTGLKMKSDTSTWRRLMVEWSGGKLWSREAKLAKLCNEG